MKIEIIPTTSAEHLARGLEKNSAFSVSYIQKNNDGKRFFPDGEIYLRINASAARPKKTVVLHSGAPNPNDGLVELEFILSFLKEKKSGPVELFLTYFPYGRQNKAFKEGEINMAETLVKRWVKNYGVKKIYIIDPHFDREKWTKKYPIANVRAYELLLKKARAKYPGIVFIAPDEGSSRRTKISGTAKKRKNSYSVEISYDDKFKKKIKGQTVGVVDDMIETGGTLLRLGQSLEKLEANKIIALVTHGVIKSGVNKISRAYDKLFLTNTIDCQKANIDISKLIINALL